MSKRKETKKGFGTYLESDLIKRIKEYCDAKGIDRTQFIRLSAEKLLKTK